MSPILRCLPLTLAIVFLPPTLAQDASASPPGDTASPGKVGLGVNIGPNFGATFSVPIQLGPSWRLEPEFGARNAALQTANGRLQSHGVLVGLGLARTASVTDQIRPYLGGRIQYATVSYSGSGLSAGSLRGAAVAGAEWLIIPRVSLGAEAQVAYTYADGDGDGLGLVPESGFHAGGVITLRLYAW